MRGLADERTAVFAHRLIRLQVLLPRPLEHGAMILRRRGHWRRANVIFIHIPKAAGTSISGAVYGRPLGHLRAADIRRIYPGLFRRLPVFAVTRNPWDRLVSAYQFAVRGGTGEAGMRNRQMYRTSAFRSFEAFIEEWLVGQDLGKLDYVFQPQSLYVTDGRGTVIVDFIGRTEAMPEVEAWLAETLGRRIAIGHRNATSERRDYRECYLHRSLINRVGDLYRADVELFDYDY
jgi:chondroitin 4-sulfotransferase 11